MAMLAERKTKPKWVLNPKASDWCKDQNKLGQKMLEKMGWSVGKGLGAKEQGPVEAIRISYKGDTRGLGAGKRKEQEDWLQQQQSFQSLLEDLNGASDKSVKVKSLEEKSRTTRTKIHYHKFARGKDISRYSEKDLSCIVGSGFVPIQIPDAVLTPAAHATASTDSNGIESLKLGPEDLSGEESMHSERSRSGRQLKPSAKVAASLEQECPSPPKKKKTKEKSTERQSSKQLGAEEKRVKKGQELKPATQSPSSVEKMPLPKKKKSKEKRTGSPPRSASYFESGSESGNDHKDREHSRSGRTYKPTPKVAGRLEERSPSPKRKTNRPTERIKESQPGSSTSVKPDGDVEHFRNGRELKPSVKGQASLNGRAPLPKKKKPKETILNSESEAGSEFLVKTEKDNAPSSGRREHKPSSKALASMIDILSSPKKEKIKKSLAEDVGKKGSSKVPVSPIMDHSRSRSGREYKPSAKILALVEETSSLPSDDGKTASNATENPVKDEKKKRNRNPSEGPSGQAQAKNQRKHIVVPPIDESDSSPKSHKQKPSKHVGDVDMNTGFPGKSSGKWVPLSQFLNSPNKEKERINSNKSKKIVSVEEEPNDEVNRENSYKTKKSSETADEIHSPSKQLKNKRKKKNTSTLKLADELTASNVGNRDNLDIEHAAVDKSYSRKGRKGKQQDVNSVESEASESSPKFTKKKKGTKLAKQSALDDEELSSSSDKSRKVMLCKTNEVEKGAAEEGSESPVKEPVRKSKKKGKITDGSDAASTLSVADEQEGSSTKELKKEKSKNAKKQAEILLKAIDDEESHSLKTKRKLKKTHKPNADQSEELETKDAGTRLKSSKNKKEKPAAKTDRGGSSESQETVVSRKQDSEDANEELASINSQSSLIYEMIGSAPSALKVGEQPEELKKYSVLVSDSEGDD